MYSILDELESVPAPLLTILLKPLHSSNAAVAAGGGGVRGGIGGLSVRGGAPAEQTTPAAQLARRVLRSAEGLLAPVVAEYFTLVLFGDAAGAAGFEAAAAADGASAAARVVPVEDEEEEGEGAGESDDEDDVLSRRRKRKGAGAAAAAKKKRGKQPPPGSAAASAAADGGGPIAPRAGGADAAMLADESTLQKTHSLIVELASCAPSLLVSVLPRLELQLRAPSETARLTACRLLGRIFASDHGLAPTAAAGSKRAAADDDSSSADDAVARGVAGVAGSAGGAAAGGGGGAEFGGGGGGGGCVAVTYKELFETLLSRMHDASEAVRLATLSHVPGWLCALARVVGPGVVLGGEGGAATDGGAGGGEGAAAVAARLAASALGGVRSRLLDPSEAVREAAVETLADWASEAGPAMLPAGALRELATRVRDKKKVVADTARQRLCALYRGHGGATAWAAAGSGGKGAARRSAAANALAVAWLPSALLAGLRTDCPSGLREAEHILETELLPADGRDRAGALGALFASLEPAGRALLCALVKNKARAQAALRAWVERKEEAQGGGGAGGGGAGRGTVPSLFAAVAKAKGSGGGGAPSSTAVVPHADAAAPTAASAAERLAACARELAAAVTPRSDGRAHAAHKELWRSLSTNRNSRIARALRALASPTTELAAARTMAAELRALLKAHLSSAEAAALDATLRAVTPGIVWPTMAAEALRPLLRLAPGAAGASADEEEEDSADEEEADEEGEGEDELDFSGPAAGDDEEDEAAVAAARGRKAPALLSARAARTSALWPILEAVAPQAAPMLQPRWPVGAAALTAALTPRARGAGAGAGRAGGGGDLGVLLAIGAHVPGVAGSPQRGGSAAEPSAPAAGGGGGKGARGGTATATGGAGGRRASAGGAGGSDLPEETLAALVSWATQTKPRAAHSTLAPPALLFTPPAGADKEREGKERAVGAPAAPPPRALPKLVAEYVAMHESARAAKQFAGALAALALSGPGAPPAAGALLALKRLCVLVPAAFAPSRPALCARAAAIAASALGAAERADDDAGAAKALRLAKAAAPWVRLYGAALAARAVALAARAAGEPIAGGADDAAPAAPRAPAGGAGGGADAAADGGGEPSLEPLTRIIQSEAPDTAARTCLVGSALSALTRALTVDSVRARLGAPELHALGWMAGDDGEQVGLLAVRKLCARLTKPAFRVPPSMPLSRALARKPLPPHLLACVMTGFASSHRSVKKAAKEGASVFTRQLRATAAAAAVAQRAAGASAPGGSARRVGLLAEIALPWLVWLVSRDESLMDSDAAQKSCALPVAWQRARGACGGAVCATQRPLSPRAPSLRLPPMPTPLICFGGSNRQPTRPSELTCSPVPSPLPARLPLRSQLRGRSNRLLGVLRAFGRQGRSRQGGRSRRRRRRRRRRGERRARRRRRSGGRRRRRQGLGGWLVWRRDAHAYNPSGH